MGASAAGEGALAGLGATGTQDNGEAPYLPVVLALGCVCATAVLWRALRGGTPADKLAQKVRMRARRSRVSTGRGYWRRLTVAARRGGASLGDS